MGVRIHVCVLLLFPIVRLTSHRSPLRVSVSLLFSALYVAPVVEAQNVRITHYPMTLDDFAAYLPPEMLKELKAKTPAEQKESEKHTDRHTKREMKLNGSRMLISFFDFPFSLSSLQMGLEAN